MKNIFQKALYFLLVAVVALGGFWLGAKTEHEGVAEQYDAMQGMLMFNHLVQFRELESDLSGNCADVALQRVRRAIDNELYDLASIEQRHPNSWLKKYISDRDPKVLDELKGIKNKFEDSWVKPKCTR